MSLRVILFLLVLLVVAMGSALWLGSRAQPPALAVEQPLDTGKLGL
jgi:hypothetical protein